MEANQKYFAFISYKRQDADWARKLKRKLENYHLPSSLNGKELPKNMRYVFRDIEELTSGNLPNQIKNALCKSQNLIVICSPYAAKEPQWINKEIQQFIDYGKTDRIFPFIIEGNPHAKNKEEECFPSALLGLTEEKERIGSNISEGGFDFAAVKLIAGMLGIENRDLWNEYGKEQKRKQWKRASFITFIFAILLGFTTSLYFQYRNIMKNQAKSIAEKMSRDVSNGNAFLGQLIGLEVISNNGVFGYPYSPEVEAAFRKASLYHSAILKGHNGNVLNACFNNNDSLVASSSIDGSIRIWNTYDGSCLHVVNEEASGHAVSFDPMNSDIIAFTSTLSVKIYNTRIKKCIMTLDDRTGTHTCVEYSHDGKKILTTLGEEIKIWDATNGDSLQILKGHDSWVTCAIFSKDDRYIISSSDDRTVKLWNIETGECLKTFTHMERVNSVCWGASKKYIVSASRENIFIWDIDTGEISQTIEAGVSRDIDMTAYNDVNHVCFNSKENVLISSANSFIHFWDKDGQCDKTITNSSGPVNSFCISHNGLYVAASSYGNTVNIYEIKTRLDPVKELGGETGTVTNAEYSPDGNLIYTSNYSWNGNKRSVYVWDANNGNLRFSDSGHTICHSKDGKLFAYASEDGKIELWDAHTLSFIKKIEHNFGDIHSISFSNNGKYLVITSNINRITVWNVGRNYKTCDWGRDFALGEGHYKSIRYAIFSPDDKNILSVYDDEISIKDLDTKRTTKRYNIDAASVEYNKTGNKIIIGSMKDGLVICDLRSDSISYVNEHRWEVMSACFSPNDKFIASVSQKGTIKIFDAKTLTCLKTWNRGAARTVYFSPEGDKIISGCTASRNSIVIHDFPPLQELIDQTRERFNNRKLTSEERKDYYLE